MSKLLIAAAIATIWGRIDPKQPNVHFHRCGYPFSKEWTELPDVDFATRTRLSEEQMLEISETDPNVSGVGSVLNAPVIDTTLVSSAIDVAEVEVLRSKVEELSARNADLEAALAAKVGVDTPAAGASDTSFATAGAEVKTDSSASNLPADPLAAIKAAISGLDKADASLFRKDGTPQVSAISGVVGFDVTGAQRDQAWAELQAAAAQPADNA